MEHTYHPSHLGPPRRLQQARVTERRDPRLRRRVGSKVGGQVAVRRGHRQQHRTIAIGRWRRERGEDAGPHLGRLWGHRCQPAAESTAVHGSGVARWGSGESGWRVWWRLKGKGDARTVPAASPTMSITPTNGTRHSGHRRSAAGPAPPRRQSAAAQGAQRPPWPHSTRTASARRSMQR